jgi:molybdopterin synthase catalytic subunit
MIRVLVTPDDFEAGAEGRALAEEGAGAVASFIGIVRGGDGLSAMTLEHYPGMTEAALTKMAQEAAARWSLIAVTLIHRIGCLTPGSQIVFVGTSAPHRQDALSATAYLIDRLKTDAPFWKQEQFNDGRTHWVDARESDDAAVARWG